MKFTEVCATLGIEEYAERIFNSNSHGELFHLQTYYHMSERIIPDKVPEFKEWFDGIVKHAEDTWERPESVFQHMEKLLTHDIMKCFKND